MFCAFSFRFTFVYCFCPYICPFVLLFVSWKQKNRVLIFAMNISKTKQTAKYAYYRLFGTSHMIQTHGRGALLWHNRTVQIIVVPKKISKF